MRAREFIVEQAGDLDPAMKDPMQHTYILPGIRNNDAYHTYRFGTAIARARAELGGYELDAEPYPAVSAMGQNAIISGFNDNVEAVIDRALKMTDTPGGKKLVSTKNSTEPKFVQDTSPIKAFKGYPR